MTTPGIACRILGVVLLFRGEQIGSHSEGRLRVPFYFHHGCARDDLDLPGLIPGIAEVEHLASRALLAPDELVGVGREPHLVFLLIDQDELGGDASQHGTAEMFARLLHGCSFWLRVSSGAQGTFSTVHGCRRGSQTRGEENRPLKDSMRSLIAPLHQRLDEKLSAWPPFLWTEGLHPLSTPTQCLSDGGTQIHPSTFRES